ncbi:MAG: PAS domain-containing protein [Methanoregula sp.]|nr:PAS domain-containing protein [Methanoregula sp.]
MNPLKSNGRRSGKGYSFSTTLFFSLILLVVVLVSLMTIYDYFTLLKYNEREFSSLQAQTEQSIEAAIQLTDLTSTILDSNLNNQMQEGFGDILTEYNRSGYNPEKMNLLRIKETLGPGYDICIINSSGVIEYTTYPPELGQDFRQVPYFYEYLIKIRQSQGFFPDRVVHELLGTGQFRKYAYMPTPDHQYILELGYATPSIAQNNYKLDDEKNIEKIVAVNPYIDQFIIYNAMGRHIEDNRLPDNQTAQYLRQAIASRQTVEVTNNSGYSEVRYLFVDLKDPAYGSDPSRIVEITYNTSRLHGIMQQIVIDHLLFGILAISLGGLLAFLISLKLTRPIKKIARDVEIITKGETTHRIGPTDTREFFVLEHGINSMLDSLHAANQMIRDDEIFRQNLIDQLPIGVFIKSTDTGRYIFWNHAIEEIYELPAKDIIGRTDREVFPEPEASRIINEDRDAIASRMEIKYKKLQSKEHGERIVHLIIVPIYDSQKSVRYILGIVEDLTDETRNLKKDLIFSITRSDILEQLTRIMTYLERAQLKATHESMQLFFDQTIGSIEAIKSQIAFVRTLQDLGVIEPRWQSAHESFTEAIHLLPPTTVKIFHDVSGVEINADPLLPRIFYGLLINSLRHGGDTLTGISFGYHREGDELVLAYEDDGAGIAASEKEKIFEFGYGNDTGLSLFLIRELLRFTEISITETGAPGKGARFELRIPKGRYKVRKE